MTKIIQKTLITAGAMVTCASIVAQPIAAIMTPAEKVAAAYTEVFEINSIYPSADYVMAHYYGLGDETKTKAINIFWTDYSTITEKEADATFADYGLTTPEWAHNFYNKTTDLTPNTEDSASWYLTRYRNTNPEAPLTDAPGVIYYTVKLANGELLSEKVDYRNCLGNEYYVADGGACKLERADNGELYYWPYKTGIRLGSDDEPKLDNEDETNSETDEVGGEVSGDNDKTDEADEEIPVVEDKGNEEENGGNGGVTAEQTAERIEEKVVATKIKAPETGILKNDGEETINTNWWWIIIPSTVMFGLLIWWFILPINGKNRHK